MLAKIHLIAVIKNKGVIQWYSDNHPLSTVTKATKTFTVVLMLWYENIIDVLWATIEFGKSLKINKEVHR